MLTGPVAAVRAVVATGAWAKSKHDMLSDTWKCGSLSFIFTHPPEDRDLSNASKVAQFIRTIVLVLTNDLAGFYF